MKWKVEMRWSIPAIFLVKHPSLVSFATPRHSKILLTPWSPLMLHIGESPWTPSRESSYTPWLLDTSRLPFSSSVTSCMHWRWWEVSLPTPTSPKFTNMKYPHLCRNLGKTPMSSVSNIMCRRIPKLKLISFGRETQVYRWTNMETNILWVVDTCEKATSSSTGLSTSAMMLEYHPCKGKFHINTHYPTPVALPLAPNLADQGAIFNKHPPSLVETCIKPSLHTSFTFFLLIIGTRNVQLFTSVIGLAIRLLKIEWHTSITLFLLTYPEETDTTATFASSSRILEISGESDSESETRLMLCGR